MLLSVRNLVVSFQTARGALRAVDGVSFDLEAGKTLGIVGESGSGKTVTGLSLLRLIAEPQGKVEAGEILLDGENLLSLKQSEMRRVRGGKIGMIFQEPMTSLNPIFTVGDQIMEAVLLHQNVSKKDAREICLESMRLVGIPDVEERINYYPHQLSGGLRQRVMIAMALSCKPKVLIADEPTTALDVTIQAQILRLMKDLQNRLGMAMIMITHDFGVIAETADEVLVMYAGKVVERGRVRELFDAPSHPYTVGLQKSIPGLHHGMGPLYTIPGIVPDLLSLPSGCRFSDRCERAEEDCRRTEPRSNAFQPTPSHEVACYHPYAQKVIA